MYSAPYTTSKIKYMSLTGLMSAIICIMAPFSIILPISPVPISLGTLAIYFAIIVLGRKQGFLSILLYILLGLVGLPVFTGFTGGVGKLLGPTGGYIIGYLFMALICGFFTDKWYGRFFPTFIGMLLGTAVCYGFGTLWLAYQSNLSISAAFAAAVLPFLPTDLLKILIAVFLGRQVRRRLAHANLI